MINVRFYIVLNQLFRYIELLVLLAAERPNTHCETSPEIRIAYTILYARSRVFNLVFQQVMSPGC